MPALEMQAEHQEEEVGSEDGVPPIEAARLRSNTGEFVAHIHSSALAFLMAPPSARECFPETLKGPQLPEGQFGSAILFSAYTATMDRGTLESPLCAAYSMWLPCNDQTYATVTMVPCFVWVCTA